MNIFNSVKRQSFKWFTNENNCAPVVCIEERSSYVAGAYLIWGSIVQEEHVLLHADNHLVKLRSASKHSSTSELPHIHCLNVSMFVRRHTNASYDIRFASDEDRATTINSVIWHLIVVYGSPFLPLRHISVYNPLALSDSAELWDPWISSLPKNRLGLPWLAKLQVLCSDFKTEHTIQNLHFSHHHIAESNYADFRSRHPAPLFLVQEIAMPEAKMELIHSADRDIIQPGDTVTVSTRVSNISRVTVYPVQYRATLPAGSLLVPNSFHLNKVPVPMSTDGFNAVTVFLRAMPKGDVIIVSYRMTIQAQMTPVLLTSGTLDFHYYPADNHMATGNQPSNVVRLTFAEKNGCEKEPPPR